MLHISIFWARIFFSSSLSCVPQMLAQKHLLTTWERFSTEWALMTRWTIDNSINPFPMCFLTAFVELHCAYVCVGNCCFVWSTYTWKVQAWKEWLGQTGNKIYCMFLSSCTCYSLCRKFVWAWFVPSSVFPCSCWGLPCMLSFCNEDYAVLYTLCCTKNYLTMERN